MEVPGFYTLYNDDDGELHVDNGKLKLWKACGTITDWTTKQFMFQFEGIPMFSVTKDDNAPNIAHRSIQFTEPWQVVWTSPNNTEIHCVNKRNV